MGHRDSKRNTEMASGTVYTDKMPLCVYGGESVIVTPYETLGSWTGHKDDRLDDAWTDMTL